MLLNKQTPLPTEILLLIARLLGPWDLINLAIAIPGLDRQYKPKYWISIKDDHGNTALHICAANQLDNFIISLLERKFDLSLTNQLGYTALHSACQYGHESSARLLLDAPSSCGLNPNTAAIGGTTALHLASKAGTLSTIQLLLDRGADMLARSSGGYTVLHWAADSGHDRVVELLLSAGTEDILSEQDDLGRTALHLAAWLGHGEVVERLLKAGADPGIRDRDGYTPADLAGQSIQGLRKLESPIIQFVSSIYTFVCRIIRRG
jgi:ankyrin repeat protein